MGRINDMEKMIVVCGPTATGKTELAIALADEFGGELVSADSRQIYKGMDIGTGKDLKSKKTIDSLEIDGVYDTQVFHIVPYDMGGIPLWMCDVAAPDSEFTVAQYQYFAAQVVEKIRERGKTPVLVGGTGLYISSVLHPFETVDIKPDMELREKLKSAPLSSIQNQVKKMIPEIWDSMNNSDRSNPYRLIRKLEIAQSKKTVSEKITPQTDIIIVGLTAKNEELYRRIDARVDKRMRQGLLEEIQGLVSKGFDWRFRSFNALGYKEWKQWFENPAMQSQNYKDNIIREWKFDEHAYARRQMTWFKKTGDIRWFDITKPGVQKNIMETVAAWYNEKR